MTVSSSEAAPQGHLTQNYQPQLDAQIVAEAPAPWRLPTTAPPKDEEWIADWAHLVTTDKQHHVLEVLARSDGSIRTLEDFATEAGDVKMIRTVRRLIARLWEAKALTSTPMTDARRGYIGERWYLWGPSQSLSARDEQAVSEVVRPAPAVCPPGMDSGSAGDVRPAPLYVVPSEEVVHAKDESPLHTHTPHQLAAKFIAALEQKHKTPIRGRGRDLMFAMIRDDGGPAVRALYDKVVLWADDPIAALVAGLKNGEHRPAVTPPIPRPSCECADSLWEFCTECYEYTRVAREANTC